MNKLNECTCTAATQVVNWRLAKRGMNGFVCAAVALLAVGTWTASAQSTLTWDITPGTVGTGNGTITGGTGAWNTSNGNWTIDAGANNIAWDNVAGTPKNDAIFGGTAGTVTLGEAISLRNLTINTANYIITGNTLNFTSGNINITQASTIRSAITGSPTMTDGGASITYLNPTSGNMTLGAITRNVDKHLYLQGSSTSSNSIASIAKGHANAKLRVESGNWTFGNVYAGEFQISGGTLTLNGTLNNEYRSAKLLTGGTINYNNAGAVRDGSSSFGTSNNDFVFNGGVLDQTRGTAITNSTHNPDMDWQGNWTFRGTNGANSDLFLGTGRVHLGGGTRQVTVENAATTLSLGGVIQQVGGSGNGLTKAGAGTLELRGVNTYTGATTVNAGTLLIKSPGSLNASSAVRVNGGTLAGNGTIHGPVTVGNLGSIAPGTPTALTGTLTINNNCTITNNLNITVNDTLSSKLVVTNALTVISGATINVTELTPPPAGALVIASYNTLVGTFATVNSASTMLIDHNYQGLNQIALIVPPAGTFIQLF